MPLIFSRKNICQLAEHADFSVRSSAASVCMRLAQYAPALVPVDILMRLSKYDEDWYVQAPANAALKAMASSMPIILGIYYNRLQSTNARNGSTQPANLKTLPGRRRGSWKRTISNSNLSAYGPLMTRFRRKSSHEPLQACGAASAGSSISTEFERLSHALASLEPYRIGRPHSEHM